ncbi:MAG: Lrp/AsnC family transcriptional regulator [Hyphomicrobium sp.]|jgi:DNA-binding Lrp family transcriptional regulator
MKAGGLDALDQAIMRALVNDARLTSLELARQVPLSPTAIARRITILEESDVIAGYEAKINHETLGLKIKAIVRVGLNAQSDSLLKAFEEAVSAISSVVSCHLVSGEDDYILGVLAQDLSDYERVHNEKLSRLPGVVRLNSSFALRTIADRPSLNFLRY